MCGAIAKHVTSVSIIICPLGNLSIHYLSKLKSISHAYYVSPNTSLVRFDPSQEIGKEVACDHSFILCLIRHLTRRCDRQVAKSEFHFWATCARSIQIERGEGVCMHVWLGQRKEGSRLPVMTGSLGDVVRRCCQCLGSIAPHKAYTYRRRVVWSPICIYLEEYACVYICRESMRLTTVGRG